MPRHILVARSFDKREPQRFGGGFPQDPAEWWSSYWNQFRPGRRTTATTPEQTRTTSPPRTTLSTRPSPRTTTSSSPGTTRTRSPSPERTPSTSPRETTSRETSRTTSSTRSTRGGAAAAGPTSSTVPIPDNNASSNTNHISDSASSPSSNKAGVAAGLTVGILAILGILIAYLFWRRRKAKQTQGSWRRLWNPAHKLSDKESTLERNSLLHERRDVVPRASLTLASRTKPLPPEPPSTRISAITPPPVSFNNSPSLYQSAATITGVQASSVVTGGQSKPKEETVRVRRGFIPSLHDELSISVGETITLVTAYDDGWCLCRNARGERGMVPLECLDRSGTSHSDMATQEGRRLSQRASSLYDGIAPGGYY